VRPYRPTIKLDFAFAMIQYALPWRIVFRLFRYPGRPGKYRFHVPLAGSHSYTTETDVFPENAWAGSESLPGQATKFAPGESGNEPAGLLGVAVLAGTGVFVGAGVFVAEGVLVAIGVLVAAAAEGVLVGKGGVGGVLPPELPGVGVRVGVLVGSGVG